MAHELVPIPRSKNDGPPGTELAYRTIGAAIGIVGMSALGLTVAFLIGGPSEKIRQVRLSPSSARHSARALAQIERILPDSLHFEFLETKDGGTAERAYRSDARITVRALRDSDAWATAVDHAFPEAEPAYVTRFVARRNESVDAELNHVRLETTRDSSSADFDLQVGSWVELEIDSDSARTAGYRIPSDAITWRNGQPFVTAIEREEPARALASRDGDGDGNGIEPATDAREKSPRERRIAVRLLERDGRDAFRVYSAELNDETVLAVPASAD